MSQLEGILRERFLAHGERHPGVDWEAVLARLGQLPTAWQVLERMEASGGEPDLVILQPGVWTFVDCSPESPSGRRSLCYDLEAWKSRKLNRPAGDAHSLAQEIGIEMLDESEYRALQSLGEFDRKTSSWIATPEPIRRLGGGLFCDRRYDTVFVYHNGAESYYASRGFRGRLLLP